MIGYNEMPTITPKQLWCPPLWTAPTSFNAGRDKKTRFNMVLLCKLHGDKRVKLASRNIPAKNAPERLCLRIALMILLLYLDDLDFYLFK